MSTPPALVIAGPGTNRDRDLALALELAGADPTIVLATELAALGTEVLPVEVSATSTFASVTDAPQQGLQIVGRSSVSLAGVFVAREQLCEELDASLKVSQYVLDRANDWGLTES